MKFTSIVLALLLLHTSAFAETKWDAQIAKARLYASEGKHAEAVTEYKELLKVIPKKDATAEILSAELVMVYYAQKDNQKTARECIKFLQKYPQSQFGFNISYILAAAQFGMERYSDAFAIFSSFPFEAIRGLNEDSKGKVYEVLIRSLVGMKREPASQALRADVNGLMVGEDGKPLLTGPVQGILDQVKTEEDLNKLIEKTPPSEQERIYALLNRTKEKAGAEPFVPEFHLGIGGSLDSITAPAVSQMMTHFGLGVELPLTPEGSSIGLKTQIDLLQISTGVAGEKLSNIRWDAFIKGRMFQAGKVIMNLMLNLHYRTSSGTGSIFAYKDILGVTAFPEFRYVMSGDTSIGLYGWFSPIAKLKGRLDSFNSILGGGADVTFKGLMRLPNSVYLEYERFRFRPTELDTGTELSRISFGYRVIY